MHACDTVCAFTDTRRSRFGCRHEGGGAQSNNGQNSFAARVDLATGASIWVSQTVVSMFSRTLYTACSSATDDCYVSLYSVNNNQLILWSLDYGAARAVAGPGGSARGGAGPLSLTSAHPSSPSSARSRPPGTGATANTSTFVNNVTLVTAFDNAITVIDTPASRAGVYVAYTTTASANHYNTTILQLN